MPATTQLSTRTRRRPRDRKKQIISAAADRFYRSGYHNVSMSDIAAEVGITAGALYRHFRSKQELLQAAITACLDQAVEAVDRGALDSLDSALDGLVSTAMERRDSGVLWSREARHLDSDQRQQVRTRISTVTDRLSVVLRTERPEVAPVEVELLTWATLSVLTSLSYHEVELPPGRLAPQLKGMAAVVVVTEFPVSRPMATSTDVPQGLGILPASRKEALLAAATRLFNDFGYHAVSMEDVGAAVGITSASVYNHFPAKGDLLFATLTRVGNALQVDMSRALATAESPKDALDTALTSYIDFALTHSGLVRMLVSEVMNLPSEHRHAVRQMQHDYVNELAHLVMADRPELSASESYILVHGALTVINDGSRTRRLRQHSNLAAELHVLTSNLLLKG